MHTTDTTSSALNQAAEQADGQAKSHSAQHAGAAAKTPARALGWEDFLAALKRTGLKRAEFAELVGISYGATIQWQKKGEAPAWARFALERHEAAIIAEAKLATLRELLAPAATR